MPNKCNLSLWQSNRTLIENTEERIPSMCFGFNKLLILFHIYELHLFARFYLDCIISDFILILKKRRGCIK